MTMTATRITIELSPHEVERLDAFVRFRNRGVVGRAVTRTSEARRILLEELQIVDKMPEAFWAKTGGHSPRIDPSS